MSEVLLSICISTFNRAAFIGETLESILSQITDAIEVVVVDGGSIDGTEAVVRMYLDRCPQLHYHRQPENQGVDRDFNHAVHLAKGRYCWLFTDDDLLKSDAIRKILHHLDSNPSLLVVNAEIRNKNLSGTLQDRALPILNDRTYFPMEWRAFFRDVSGYASFIGGIIIRKDIWDRREKESYFGTEFIHVGVIFQEPIDGEMIALATPLILIRYGNAQWSPRSFEIWMFKWPKLIWSFPDFTDLEKSMITPKEPWQSMKELIVFRAKGCYSIKEYKKWLAPRIPPSLKKLTVMAISLFPGAILNPFCLFYFSTMYKRQRMMRLDLTNSRFYYKNALRFLFKSFTG